MSEDAGQKRTSDTLVLVDRRMLPMVIATGIIASVLMPFIPTGFIAILPSTVFVGHFLFIRRAWRKELHDLMTTSAVPK